MAKSPIPTKPCPKCGVLIHARQKWHEGCGEPPPPAPPPPPRRPRMLSRKVPPCGEVLTPDLWRRMETWLANQAPHLANRLAPPATLRDLAVVEKLELSVKGPQGRRPPDLAFAQASQPST